LIHKYNSLPTEEEKQNLFRNTICIRNGRKLGPAFSKVMYKVFCSEDPNSTIKNGKKNQRNNNEEE
jgi:hypothetical protein